MFNFRSLKWFRNLYCWKLLQSYFPAKLHKTVDLPADRNYIFAAFPHGVLRWVVSAESVACTLLWLCLLFIGDLNYELDRSHWAWTFRIIHFLTIYDCSVICSICYYKKKLQFKKKGHKTRIIFKIYYQIYLHLF